MVLATRSPPFPHVKKKGVVALFSFAQRKKWREDGMGQGRLLLVLLAAALLAAADSSDFDDDDDAPPGASGAVSDALTIEVPVPRSRPGAFPASRARPIRRP